MAACVKPHPREDGIREVTLRFGLDVRNGADEAGIVNRSMIAILGLSERIGIRRAPTAASAE